MGHLLEENIRVICWTKPQTFIVVLLLTICCCLAYFQWMDTATDRSSVERKLDNLLLFSFLLIDGPSVATDESSIVHHWFVPTEQELQMSFFLTLGIIDTKSYPTVDLIKKELAGATTIKREALIVPGDADDVAINIGDDVNIGVDIDDVGAKSGGEHVDDVGGIYGGFTPSVGGIYLHFEPGMLFSYIQYFYILNTYFFLLEMIPRLHASSLFAFFPIWLGQHMDDVFLSPKSSKEQSKNLPEAPDLKIICTIIVPTSQSSIAASESSVADDSLVGYMSRTRSLSNIFVLIWPGIVTCIQRVSHLLQQMSCLVQQMTHMLQ
ncbi:hypothetical protein H5410_026581 [Solanum commersonii]|uniref:Uncharacterized protein n=1 Tax=Solanum commersonii TaxID=4109 RepID=A0A9J5YWY8_SOLCO|nr:hypothetical protein H5410_026581 [Solanum commersonii]